MSKSIEDLREHLFAQLDALRGKTAKDEIDQEIRRAKAISEVAGTIIASAKVEVDYLRANQGGESAFLAGATGAKNLPEGLPPGITGVRRHRLAG